MEEKKNLVEQLNEASLEFAKQFDPQSESYHKGLQIPVPLGGKNIPQGMSTEYDPTYEEQKKNLDALENNPEYQKLSQIRDHFVQLKNYLNKLCIPYEGKKTFEFFQINFKAILRHTENFKTKANPNNSKHLDTYNKNVQTEKIKIEEILIKLNQSQEFIQNTANIEYEKILQQLKEIMKDISTQKFENKEQLAEYQFLVKKTSQLAFAEANKILQEMKKIKGIETKTK